MLEIAARDWKHVFEQAPIDKSPTLWVGHYSGNTSLGSIWAHHASDEAGLVLILGSPFALSEDISDTIFILQRPFALMMTHLGWNGRGVHIADWKLPYTINDKGKVKFEVASKQLQPSERLREAANTVADHRLRGNSNWNFIEAFQTAAKWGHLHEA